MSDQNIQIQADDEVKNTAPVLRDRRRPGRLDDVSPELIPLLRHPDDLEPDRDDARPATGIVIAVMLSVPLWAGMALLVRWIVR